MNPKSIRIGLHGCDLNTGNLGVSALGLSTMLRLQELLPQSEFVLLGYESGTGLRSQKVGAATVEYKLLPIVPGMRLDRISNLKTMRIAQAIGLGNFHPTIRKLKELDVVLDISGGDSFTDLYGARRVAAVFDPKEFFLSLKIPLILLPQTYGPLVEAETRQRCANIAARSKSSWARDTTSTRLLCDALREFGLEANVNEGIDVAFALPAIPPNSEYRELLAKIRSKHQKLIGINTSGLLFNQEDASQKRFGFKDKYAEIIRGTIDVAINNGEHGVLLVPHVVTPCEDFESDYTASLHLIEEYCQRGVDNLYVLPEGLNAMETKWIISQCDFFTGARMHACIGAISQGIPTSALAYSDKAAGVFQTIGAESLVVDARKMRAKEINASFEHALESTTAIRLLLVRGVKQTQVKLETQFSEIAAQIHDT